MLFNNFAACIEIINTRVTAGPERQSNKKSFFTHSVPKDIKTLLKIKLLLGGEICKLSKLRALKKIVINFRISIQYFKKVALIIFNTH